MDELTDIRRVINAVQEQGETICLLQAELGFQKERIDKQDGIIKELRTKVDDLSIQLAMKKNVEDKNEDASNIWKDTANLSIAEAVKETAEKALMTNLGFVFDPNTRLYCNYSTGYYYDPGQELFYNGHTGIYYTYDADNQKYIFHSQVNIEQPQADAGCNTADGRKSKRNKDGKYKSKKSNQVTALYSPLRTLEEDEERKLGSRTVSMTESKPKVKTKLVKSEDGADMEEGELSDGSSSDEVEIVGEYYSALDLDNSSSSSIVEEEHPPCIRAIILETCSPTIKKGSLFLVTCMGGTIGREELHNIITLPDDTSVDNHHATIMYSLPGKDDNDEDPSQLKKKYLISDAGSSTGTFLNGVRLSEPQQASEPHELVHGSTVKVGGFSILMHIHPGSFTCGHCEPGLLMESSEESCLSVPYQNVKPKTRNALMKQIKKKYGLDGRTPTTQPHVKTPDSDPYKDRAKDRRLKKGSDNPYEKTEVVNVGESISENNKGFKMLSKMGWKEGKSLGNADSQGLLEPITLELKNDRAGLGMAKLGPTTSSVGHKKKGKNSTKSSSISNRADQLAITIKRFKEATDAKMDVDENPSKL